MKRGDFEHSVLSLWMTSRVPLTRANLQFYSGVERKQLERWLDEMVKAGSLDFDSDDAGEVLYTVPGGERPAGGASDLSNVAAVRANAAAARKLDELRRSLPKSKSLVRRASLLPSLPAVTSSGSMVARDRSLVAAGALSFFLGPLGWLYAAPLKEAAPAIVVFLIAFKLIPAILLYPLLGIFMPLSALAGISYAWLYNRQGGRTSLVDLSKKQLPPHL